MKISELTKPKELTDIRAKAGDLDHSGLLAEIEKMMTGRNFTKIGKGAWADVYSHPNYPDSVFKIFNNDNKTKIWLTYCFEHKGNPFVPKVKGRPIQITDTAYVARLEKLEFNWDLQTKMEDFLMLVFEYWKDLIDPHSTDIIKERIGKDRPEFVSLLDDNNFMNTFKAIMTITKGGEPDLHHENFMFRNGTQLVITDPV